MKNLKATSYGILQTKYKGKPYTQVSILGSDSDEENDISSAILAYYLFSPTELDSDDNHKYVEVASAPFLSAQNDFSSYQLGVFKKLSKVVCHSMNNQRTKCVKYKNRVVRLIYHTVLIFL